MTKFNIPYTVVPDKYREYIPTNQRLRKKNHQEINDPLILDLLAGKTLLVDAKVPVPFDKRGPFRNLYSFFSSRGYTFRLFTFDDIDKGIFRGVLMWLEAFYRAWYCLKCGRLTVTVGDVKPYPRMCKASGNHRWKEIIELEEKSA